MTLPKLSRAGKQRLAKARATAEIELRQNLTGYFRQSASSESRDKAAREEDVTPWISAYAMAVYDALTREYAVCFTNFQEFRDFVEWRLPAQVLAEIWPPTNGGRSRKKSPASVSSVLERAIRTAWIEAS